MFQIAIIIIVTYSKSILDIVFISVLCYWPTVIRSFFLFRHNCPCFRYMLLAYCMAMRTVSFRVKKRFPDLQHLVDAGLMRDDELKVSICLTAGVFYGNKYFKHYQLRCYLSYPDKIKSSWHLFHKHYLE